MAWQIMPIELNKSFKTSLKRMYNIPEDFVGSLIEQLVLEGKVKRYGLRMYTLSNDTLIETMARIRNTPDEFAHRDINNYRYMKSLPDAMRLFMQGRDKEAALQIPDTCNYSVFNPILLPLLVRNDTLKHFFNMMSQVSSKTFACSSTISIYSIWKSLTTACSTMPSSATRRCRLDSESG